MTRPGFITIRPGFRVSEGATLGFISRCGNYTARRFRNLFKTTAPAHDASLAARLGCVGASGNVQVVSHAPSIGVETKHDDGSSWHEQRAAERKEDASDRP